MEIQGCTRLSYFGRRQFGMSLKGTPSEQEDPHAWNMHEENSDPQMKRVDACMIVGSSKNEVFPFTILAGVSCIKFEVQWMLSIGDISLHFKVTNLRYFMILSTWRGIKIA